MQRLRRIWIRFLFGGAGLLLLLVGLWWLRSQHIGNDVRRVGGRYRSVHEDSFITGVLRSVSGSEPRVSHFIDFEGSNVDDQWLLTHREQIRGMPSLVLFLRETRVTGDGLSALHGLPNLTFLDLTGTPLTDGDVAHIAAIPHLTQLYIGHTGISDAALGELSQLPNLNFVCLDAEQTTSEGVENLATIRPGGVMLLDANDACVERLSQLSGLTSLDLVGEDVTAASLPTLQRLQGLQSLMFYGTDFSDNELNELRQALPGCFIEQRETADLDQAREDAWKNQDN